VVTNSWSSVFDDVLRGADSDFVRGVLEDKVITAEEYREALQGQVTCLNDAGTDARLGPGGELEIDVQPSDEIMDQCWRQWDGGISGLYGNLRRNPDKLDHYELMAACFVRQGLAPEGFSGQDFHEWLLATGIQVPGQDTPVAPSPAPTLPGGVSWDDSRVGACYDDPLR
jgi:hypothetical protein